MTYELKNQELTLQLSSRGAELQSARRGDCEYMWQRDPEFWTGSAPILFPICGRLTEGKYTYEGKTYEMKLHGFARHSEFEAEQLSDTEIIFTLRSDETTLAQYPFPFVLKVLYRLEGAKLVSEVTVTNTGDGVMPFAFGAHPGFLVPLDGAGSFADYYLEFGSACSPDHLLFSDTCYQTGKKRAFPLEEGKRLSLRHDLFDNDAIFLARCADSVTLRSDCTPRFVQMSYPNMPYLGLWHKPCTEAPYVCIEPWCGLPAYDGVVDDFGEKSDMFRMGAGEEKQFVYSILFG